MAKIKLIENSLSIIPKENIQINTKNLLIEQEGTAYYCKGVLKEVPITRYTKNENDRIYDRPLWDRVSKIGVFENSLCLADHSEDDGSVKDICGIWKNFQVLNDHAVADLYSVGEYGQLLMDFVLNSGRAGFSTVGYGELDESNTVDPESYEYCRTDWVINPSQNVYATKENAVDDAKSVTKVEEPKVDEAMTPTNILENSSVIKENVESKNDNNLNNSITNKIDNSDNNIENIKNKEVKYMDKIQEANFKNHVNVLIKDARKKENISEGIDDLKSIVIPEEFTVIKEKVDSAITEMQSKLQEQKTNAEKTLSEKEKELSEVKSKYEASTKVAEELKTRYAKAKTLLEKINKEKVAVKAVGSEKLIKERKDMISDIKQFIEDRKNMRKDISSLYNKLKEAETRIKVYEKELKELGYVFEDANAPILPVSEPDKKEEPIVAEEDETLDTMPQDPEKEIMGEEDEEEIMADDENRDVDEMSEENWDADIGAIPPPENKNDIEVAQGPVNANITEPGTVQEEEGDEIQDDDRIEVDEENWDASIGDMPQPNPVEGITNDVKVTEEEEDEIPEYEFDEENWDIAPGEGTGERHGVEADINNAEIVNKLPEEDEDDIPYELPDEGGENDDVLMSNTDKDKAPVSENEEDEMAIQQDVDSEIEDDDEEEPIEEDSTPENIRAGIFQGTDTKTLGARTNESVRGKKVMQKKVVKKGSINQESIAKNIRAKMLMEELIKFADSEIKKNSAVKDIKKHILASKSLVEAVEKVRKFKMSRVRKDSPVKISESSNNTSKPDSTWLGGRR